MFNARMLSSPSTRAIFFTFVAHLKTLVDSASHTRVHAFLKTLEERGQLLRCYTQNIDGLERRVGLSMPEPGCAVGGRVVQLHGALSHLRCTVCPERPEFREEYVKAFMQGEAPDCPTCMATAAVRETAGRRAMPTGELRPNITMYDDNNTSDGEFISSALTEDLKRGKPDLVLVMGTSLKVDGIKTLVKDVARAVHDLWRKDTTPTSSNSQNANGDAQDLTPRTSKGTWRGQVIYINKTMLTQKEWESVIDVQVQGNADEICRLLESMLIERDKARSGLKQRCLSFPVRKRAKVAPASTAKTPAEGKGAKGRKLAKSKSDPAPAKRKTTLEPVVPIPTLPIPTSPRAKRRKTTHPKPAKPPPPLAEISTRKPVDPPAVSPENFEYSLPSPGSPALGVHGLDPEVVVLSPSGTKAGRAKLPTPTESDGDKTDEILPARVRTRTQSGSALQRWKPEVVVTSPVVPSPDSTDQEVEQRPGPRRRLFRGHTIGACRPASQVSTFVHPITPEDDGIGMSPRKGHPSPQEMRHPAMRRGLRVSVDPSEELASDTSMASTVSVDSLYLTRGQIRASDIESTDLSDPDYDESDDDLWVCRSKTDSLSPPAPETPKAKLKRQISQDASLSPELKRPKDLLMIPLPPPPPPPRSPSPSMRRRTRSSMRVDVVDLRSPGTAVTISSAETVQSLELVRVVTPNTRARCGGLPPMELPVSS